MGLHCRWRRGVWREKSLEGEEFGGEEFEKRGVWRERRLREDTVFTPQRFTVKALRYTENFLGVSLISVNLRVFFVYLGVANSQRSLYTPYL